MSSSEAAHSERAARAFARRLRAAAGFMVKQPTTSRRPGGRGRSRKIWQGLRGSAAVESSVGVPGSPGTRDGRAAPRGRRPAAARVTRHARGSLRDRVDSPILLFTTSDESRAFASSWLGGRLTFFSKKPLTATYLNDGVIT